MIGYLLANQFPSILLEWLNLFFFDFQVSVEYGLCEMLNSQAIRSGLSPKDGKWGFNISELEAILPAGTVDNTVEPVYKEVYIKNPFHLFIFYHTSAQWLWLIEVFA